MKKTIKDIAVENQRVFVRVDFNVPRDKVTGEITDDTRIRAALPTIQYLIENGAKVVLASHLGRPKGEADDSLRLNKVAERLATLIGREVIKVDEAIGEQVEAVVNGLEAGQVVLLENIRFYAGETKNDVEFAKELAKLADIYVNDAFGAAHRAHASTAGITEYVPAVAGLLMEKEIAALSGALENSKTPFVAIIGGAKVSDKIGVIENLLTKVDKLIIGGGMANTFLEAQGYNMAKSLVEKDKVELAAKLIADAKEQGREILLPVDLVVADGIDLPETKVEVKVDAVPENKMALDIGSETVKLYQNAVKDAKTVIWNGPMGVFEVDAFANGTNQVAQAVADSSANSIVGGGDSVAAIEKAGLSAKICHISTGGGASLEFLEGKALPGVVALQDN